MTGLVPQDFDSSSRFTAPLQDADRVVQELERNRPKGRATKAFIEAFEAAQGVVRSLQKANATLQELTAGRDGWLAFFHSDSAHGIRAISLLSPDLGTRIGGQFGMTTGAFNHALFAPCPKPRGVLKWKKLIVLRNEIGVLQLQSLMARVAEARGASPEAGFLFACATGPEPDGATIRRVCRSPFVCYEADASGSDSALIEDLRQWSNLKAFAAPDGSLDTFVKAHLADPLKGQERLRLAIETRLLYTRPYQRVRDEADGFRFGPGKALGINRAVGRTLVADLRERGQFYNDGRRGYVFLHDEKQLVATDVDDLNFVGLLAKYGLAPSENTYTYVVDAVQLEAREQGKRIRVHDFTSYNRRRNLLYVFDFERHVYRISQAGVEKFDNGKDDVLFLSDPTRTPFTLGRPTGHLDALREAVFGGPEFVETDLTQHQQRILLEFWFYSLFFPELLPTRVIVAMVGPAGSVKTFVLKKTGQLLYGPQFGVTPMAEDSKDFDAAITNSQFVVLDNVDTGVKWLNDRLAIAATGGTLKRREYFTTNRQVEFPVTAFLALTSRTPHFRREDVADRLLLFHCQRRFDFAPEDPILLGLAANRNAHLTEVAGQLQKCLGGLATAAGKPVSTKLRIADFASFAHRVAPALGFADEVQAILDGLVRTQSTFAVSEDPLVQMLDKLLEQPGVNGREMSTGELFGELAALSASSSMHLPFRSAQSLGYHLNDMRNSLSAIFNVRERQGRSRVKFWSFTRKPETA